MERLGNDPLKEKGGIEGLIRDTRKDSKQSLQSKQSKQKELDTQRATFHLKKEIIKKIKDHAYWERKGISELLNEILGNYFKNKTS